METTQETRVKTIDELTKELEKIKYKLDKSQDETVISLLLLKTRQEYHKKGFLEGYIKALKDMEAEET